MSSQPAPSTVVIVFPHQLFKNHPAISRGCSVYLVEEELFFTQYNFNRKKLVLHRASMKYYEGWLKDQQCKVHYIECGHDHAGVAALTSYLGESGCSEIRYADVHDDWLEKRLTKAAAPYSITLRRYDTPAFLNTMADIDKQFDGITTYFQTSFYIAQRKLRKILLTRDGQPVGGRWSFDANNRLRFPKGLEVPPVPLPVNEQFVPEAINYVDRHFPENYGNTEPPFFKKNGFYPVTHDEAEQWLGDFLSQRFANFGAYEDAMVASEGLLYHSGLSAMLNIGLLTPQQVIDEVLEYAGEAKIAINSVEGFIRQVTGWREFVHLIYRREGVKQRNGNFWGFTRKIPESFWSGTTGIVPVDRVIHKTLQSSYAHHIERLMVMGNFMLLCEFDPDEVYRWFMEMYIDAYDWVMVPNTYGMTQFADGGLMTTKPYISGSNYLLKMGNWEKGKWQEIWDGLFWRFLSVHRDFFESNPRLGMLLKNLDKMDRQKRKSHLRIAESFLRSLDKQPPGIDA
ncbi:MAG: cryptochrome/photolyase family protein [Chitinophagaceae bacterium]|nr:MAG: cryptochrome/photolyase family protein [Chitinophagaceae bacterium]